MVLDDFPEEQSQSIQVDEIEGGFANPVSSGGEDQQHQQSSLRKRKFEAAAEGESGSDPRPPALKLLHVEEEQDQQHHGEQNNDIQSALIISQIVGELSIPLQILGENEEEQQQHGNEQSNYSRSPSVKSQLVGEMSVALQVFDENDEQQQQQQQGDQNSYPQSAMITSQIVGGLSSAFQSLGENVYSTAKERLTTNQATMENEEQKQQHDGEQNNYPQSALTSSQMVSELSSASQILGVNEAQQHEQHDGDQDTYVQSTLISSQIVGELSTASQILGENVAAAAAVTAAIEGEEEGFIRNAHQSALEALLVDEGDRADNSCKESLSELIRSVVEDEIPSGDEYNNNVAFRTHFEPPPILGGEEGLRSLEFRSRADLQNVLSTAPVPDLKTLHGMEIAEQSQVVRSNQIQSKFDDALPAGESYGEHEVTEMHVNDPASELETPLHILHSRVEDESQLRVTDPQTELEALHVEEEKVAGHEAAEMRVDDNLQQHPELVDLPAEENGRKEVDDIHVEHPQFELEALRLERKGGDNEIDMRVDHHLPQAELEALQHVEEMIHGELDTTQMLPVGDDPCGELGFVHAVMSAAQDVASMSVGDFHPGFESLHVVENSSLENESILDMNNNASQSAFEAMNVVENERVEGDTKVQQVCESSAAKVEAPIEVGENNSAEESQSPDKKRNMILLAAVAAFFSTLAGALGSIGELIGHLERTAMGGVFEDRDGHCQSTGFEGMASTFSSSSLSESSALRLHSAMTRSSTSLRNNIVVSMFLLMQEHRKRIQKRPRELTGPWYIKPRSAQAIESFLDFSPQGDPDKFRELFRISPNLFFQICEMVRDEMLSDTPTSLRVLPNRVLTVERQVAIAIRRLATGNQFLGIADSFGVSKSTAVKVTWKFIVAFIKKARPLHLQWPSKEQMQHIKDGFKSQWGFPNCCGVVDGTHFTVEFPKGEDASQYCDHQNHLSISMQAIVGHDQRFLDVVVGWPGSVQEYQLLQNTNFYRNVVVTKERLNGDHFVTQDGSSLEEYVLGDGGYPLYSWLMVPYPSGLSAPKDEWNSRHALARQCVEDALVRLKGTWRILSRILWKPRKERIGKMVFACCLLHNMIIERQDGLNPEVYAGVNPHPGGYTGVSIPTDKVHEGGPEAREVLFREVMGGGMI